MLRQNVATFDLRVNRKYFPRTSKPQITKNSLSSHITSAHVSMIVHFVREQTPAKDQKISFLF